MQFLLVCMNIAKAYPLHFTNYLYKNQGVIIFKYLSVHISRFNSVAVCTTHKHNSVTPKF